MVVCILTERHESGKKETSSPKRLETDRRGTELRHRWGCHIFFRMSKTHVWYMMCLTNLAVYNLSMQIDERCTARKYEMNRIDRRKIKLRASHFLYYPAWISNQISMAAFMLNLVFQPREAISTLWKGRTIVCLIGGPFLKLRSTTNIEN